MNEELQKQLAEVVKKSLELAERSGKFVMDQAPELLNEFYRWKVFDSVFDMLVGILIFLTVRYAPMLWLSDSLEEFDRFDSPIRFFNKYGESSGAISWAMFIIGSIFSFTMIICSIHTLLFITVSPKMYLINYFLK